MKTVIHLPKPIAKSNKPVAVLSIDEYESLLETVEILSDQPLIQRIASALDNINKGKFFQHGDVFPKRYIGVNNLG